MTICDAVPTRAHDLAEDESLRHIGKLVNCDVGTGQHGYAVIRGAKAAFAEVLARRCCTQGGVTQAESADFVAPTAAPADQVRNQALEEAAKTAEATRVATVQYGLSLFQDGDGTRRDIAEAIRTLKSAATQTTEGAGNV